MPMHEKNTSPILDSYSSSSDPEDWHHTTGSTNTTGTSPRRRKRNSAMISSIAQASPRRMIAGVVVFVVFFIWLTSTFRSSLRPLPAVPRFGGLKRVAKVSMLYGKPNAMYERAIKSHERHNQKWGLDMHVLRQDISVGFWNKPAYLLSLVINELAKHPEERTEWLMWVDADSIILNNNIPAEIFLPPSDLTDIHLVATKDQNGLNTGIMFLHVHPWTVTMLTEALGYPLFKPEVDLGRSADQESMGIVLKKDKGAPNGKGYKENMVYIPRPLINTYEFKHGYEGDKGSLLVHFPGLEADRWPHMAKWLDIVETRSGDWELPLEKTQYPNQTTVFWDQVRQATRGAAQLQKKIDKMPNGTDTEIKEVESRKDAVRQLKKTLYETADDMEALRDRISKVDGYLE